MLDQRYELHEPMGSGGMGCVYRARHVGLDVPVVVKVLKPDLAASQQGLELFRSEAFLLGRVTHPNVVSILDFGTIEDGPPYMVLEHVNGCSLRELLRDEGPQPASMVVSVSRQLLAGLAACHAAGFAHGDVTSGNVMMSRLSDGLTRVKLIDFGLASPLGALPAKERVWGTPGYMSPEIMSGGAPSVASDLYSAAIVIHELLTGAMPPLSLTSEELLAGLTLTDDGVPAVRSRLARATQEGALSRFRSRTVTANFPRPLIALPLGRSRARTAAERLRDGIGRSLRLGDMDHTVELYLALGTMLKRGGDPADALTELVEAVDIVTFGHGAEGAEGPPELWRLLLFIAEIQAQSGSARAARVSAAHAHRHAARVGSTRGLADVVRLVRRL